MGSRDDRLLPYLCECGALGCLRRVPATVADYEAATLFAPGHEPESSVAELDHQRRDRDRDRRD